MLLDASRVLCDGSVLLDTKGIPRSKLKLTSVLLESANQKKWRPVKNGRVRLRYVKLVATMDTAVSGR